MTSSLGRPSPVPYVAEEDLLELAGDLGAGIFPSSDLYNWYAMTVEQAGRKPVTKKRFGMSLKEARWVNSTRYMDGKVVRCWMINKPWARRGAEWVKTAGTDPATDKEQP